MGVDGIFLLKSFAGQVEAQRSQHTKSDSSNNNKLRQLLNSESGNASMELIYGALILLLPVLYLIITLSSLQGASLATLGAANQGARLFTRSVSNEQALNRVQQAVETALYNHGIDSEQATVSISCSSASGSCLAANALVTVRVEVIVQLPLFPDFIPIELKTIKVGAESSHRVSKFWSSDGKQ